MVDFLSRMSDGSLDRVRNARARETEASLRRRAADTAAVPRLCLSATGFDLIAEIKQHSPSAGALAEGTSEPNLVRRAVRYVAAGAAVVSVLTEPSAFGGHLEHLTTVAHAIDAPVLRKDFLVDPYQIFEARVAGASGVLLIVRLVDPARLVELVQAAAEAGLFVLIEAFDGEELALAAEVARGGLSNPPTLLGLNARNLTTLDIDSQRHAALADRFPPEHPPVAESGIETPDDAARVAALGYRLALVGTALMRADDPGKLVAAMLEAGRRKAAPPCA